MPSGANGHRSVKRRHALNGLQKRRRMLFLSLIAVSTLLCSQFRSVNNCLDGLCVRWRRPFLEVNANYSDDKIQRAYRMSRNYFTGLELRSLLIEDRYYYRCATWLCSLTRSESGHNSDADGICLISGHIMCVRCVHNCSI